MLSLGEIIKNNREKKTVKFIVALLITFVILNVVMYFFVDIILISGRSMSPTCGDRTMGVVVNTRICHIDRFDIVSVKRKNKKRLIKRVIGVPGDTINYTSSGLYINGELYDEPYLDKNEPFSEEFNITLMDDEYFLMGDNRNNSIDSRTEGPVSLSEIKGKVILVIK